MSRPETPGRRTALVVDDNAFVRNFVREVLENHGFKVYVATDGRTAASIYDSNPGLSVIVTDILMPAADGIGFIFKVRHTGISAFSQPKIIAISGGGEVSSELYLEDAQSFGADAALAKPFSDRDLTE